ncbi:hypothetical protein H2200_001221 [Cladophialophora chaetospira]|uniref:Uncharacterized protein n=1 Tax=Cladophialophora chaetospira TaxID=386627 RepID=A0AA38XKG2_9EURO|nr:hypothetical protein H2200_001221 [Cladophialophora chaetospira]
MAAPASAPLLSPSDGHSLGTRAQKQQNLSGLSPELSHGSRDSLAQKEKAHATDVHSQKIGGAILDITWALTCLSLPMVVLTAIFIGLVYGYKVSNSRDASTDLTGRRSSLDGSAYYVDYSATRLVTVSSWTSTVASFTTTFVMVLVSYPLARDFLRKSKSGSPESLPTPYQLSLIIGLLQGGFGPFWSWLQYCFQKDRHRQPTLLWVALMSVLGGTTLSLAILGADTWLHIVTSTINLDVLSPPAPEPALGYGRSLAPECYNTSFTPGSLTQCIGNIQPPSQIAFPTVSEATQTSLNLSSINAALSCSIDHKNFAFLTAARRNPNLDFRASTYAISTTCAPASKACNLQNDNTCQRSDGCPLGIIQYTLGSPYNCSADLYGDMNNPDDPGSAFLSNGSSFGTYSNINFFLQMFRRPGFSDPIGSVEGQEETPNPFYFALGGTVATSNALSDDPEAIASNQNFNSAFIFNCTSTVYELDYIMINGTFAGGNYTKANATLSNNIGWTLLNADARALSRNNLESAFISGAQQTNTSQSFADFFAQGFSRSTISMIAGITNPKMNSAEQLRENRLITRLPKAPFFTLIVLNLLFAALGIALAVVALLSQPRRTRNIQARLSTAGLVAALLEPRGTPDSGKSNKGIENMFAEYHGQPLNTGDDRVMVVDSATDNRVFQKFHSGGFESKDAPIEISQGRTINSVHGPSQLQFRRGRIQNGIDTQAANADSLAHQPRTSLSPVSPIE